MANNFAANLDGVRISDRFFSAFHARLAPIETFATDFAARTLPRGTKSVEVPVYSSKSSSNFTGRYSNNADSAMDYVEVTIDRHKYNTINLSDTELANTQVEWEELAEKAGQGLAEDVFADMLSPLTTLNFYYAVESTSAAFDSDKVVDIKARADEAKMPKSDRTLLLNDTYYNALLKDPAISDSDKYGSREAIEAGTIRELLGFNVVRCAVPDNSENLEGIAVFPSMLAVAMRYLAPHRPDIYASVRRLTNPETGITIGVRDWIKPEEGTRYLTFECNYGRARGQEEAGVRLTSSEILYSIDDEVGDQILDEESKAILYKPLPTI